jgi:hypothetical protein
LILVLSLKVIAQHIPKIDMTNANDNILFGKVAIIADNRLIIIIWMLLKIALALPLDLEGNY